MRKEIKIDVSGATNIGKSTVIKIISDALLKEGIEFDVDVDSFYTSREEFMLETSRNIGAKKDVLKNKIKSGTVNVVLKESQSAVPWPD